ncbi:MarR family transcriptional regulator [Anaerocolumna sedimenticola]|uniref:MarR family transcriptional regulator n=1 Tax=Anaerocolumna sedimenticola TaxID=2696063 RepID=A0A6P1TGZ7_9FIRM|nr:MarR family winged helix-turn-helix transcriptional regulator [Anaerocolumna sedimenticola]QHQ59577.1 MarR family transcriptional regulator [Anaerocolumna sedimenticola]
MKSSIRELFIRAERARKQLLSPVLSAIGLTPGQGQAGILNTLLKEDRLNQKELSCRCHMDTTTMSRNIDNLEKMGLLKREMNPESRRSVIICLTEKGREKALNICEMFIQFESTIKKDISEEDMEVFRRILINICENLEENIPQENQL